MDSLSSFTRSGNKRELDDPEESPELKRFRSEFILHMLDDVDDRSPDSTVELDSVVRSLEEEIGLCPAPPADETAQPELGFLLEASDDELGLPPTAEEEREREGVSGGFWGFEEEISNCYDGLDLGFGRGELVEGEGVVFDDGLFEDFGDVALLMPPDLWRQEGLPAL